MTEEPGASERKLMEQTLWFKIINTRHLQFKAHRMAALFEKNLNDRDDKVLAK